MGISLNFVISSFFLILRTVELGASQDDYCKASRCGAHGPDVRFPFWLANRQQKHCGYPGFILSCTEKNDTVLELPFPVKMLVERIDYESQVIYARDPNGCLPRTLQKTLNLSASPLQYINDNLMGNYSLFDCPTSRSDSSRWPISCLSFPGHHVYAFDSDYSLEDLDLSSCNKSGAIQSVPYSIFETNNVLPLSWSEPLCGACEAVGGRCRLKNGTKTKTECSESLHRAHGDLSQMLQLQCVTCEEAGGICILKNDTETGMECSHRAHHGSSVKLIVAGAIMGLFLLVKVLILVYRVWNEDKIEKENQVKIEKFLEDYKALKPTRYSYADIKRITNNFNDKLGQGGDGIVYKGNLSSEIFVAVKILNNSTGNGEEFITEVGTMGRIHHVNVVRLVGFCADGFRRALVYEFLPNDSLEKFILPSSGKTNSLGWEKLQHIALGMAKGIEYLHQGCDKRILHFDIKPHNILLDNNFNPKISDFGLAKLCSKEQSVVSMNTARGTMGYIAPEVFSRNFGSVSYKSDVYSFGMVLLEMVGGKKNIGTTTQNTSQVYFPEWVYNRLENGEELEIQIDKGEDSKIARKLTIVGLYCIQWHPSDRPSMKFVIQMLEGDGENLAMPPNPFASTNLTNTSAPMHGRPFNNELEVISELE